MWVRIPLGVPTKNTMFYKTKYTSLKQFKRKVPPSFEFIFSLLSDEVWLAGGALRYLVSYDDMRAYTPNDFDIFFANNNFNENFTKIVEKLERFGANLIFQCPEGKLFTYASKEFKVQLITDPDLRANDPISLIDRFDFTSTLAAFDGTYLYWSPRWVRTNISKKLHLHRLTFPMASMKRLSKLAQIYNVNPAIEEIVQLLLNSLPMEFNEDSFRFYID